MSLEKKGKEKKMLAVQSTEPRTPDAVLTMREHKEVYWRKRLDTNWSDVKEGKLIHCKTNQPAVDGIELETLKHAGIVEKSQLTLILYQVTMMNFVNRNVINTPRLFVLKSNLYLIEILIATLLY